jgi:hypothetical protein
VYVSDPEVIRHAQDCGPCADCREALADYREVYFPKRDSLISYGLPPRLTERFQRTGKGPMFEPPTVVKPAPGWTMHLVETGADGIARVPSLPVTPKLIERHVKRHGPEMVVESGFELPPELAAQGQKRRRHTSFTMKQQVRALRDRGLSQMAIADTLNISDARAKKLLAELAA